MELTNQQAHDFHQAYHLQGMRDRDCRLCQIGQGAREWDQYAPYLATENERQAMQSVIDRYHTS